MRRSCAVCRYTFIRASYLVFLLKPLYAVAPSVLSLMVPASLGSLYLLEINVDLENVVSLRPLKHQRWVIKFRCPASNEGKSEDRCVDVCDLVEVDVPGRKARARTVLANVVAAPSRVPTDDSSSYRTLPTLSCPSSRGTEHTRAC